MVPFNAKTQHTLVLGTYLSAAAIVTQVKGIQ